MRKALASALVAPAGCGSQDGSAPKASAAVSIVDPKGTAPLVNSLEVEPGTGNLLVTTNRGFFRVKRGAAEPIELAPGRRR